MYYAIDTLVRVIFFEIGVFAAYGMYEEYGGAPSAGVVGGFC